MELRQLEQFVAVAEEGQFTRAATRCHLAQSALSTSIRTLERELGAALFVRTTRRVTLTAAGRALLIEARRTLSAAAAAQDAVRDVQELRRGSLAVGGVPTFSLLDQPELLRRFRTEHPGMEIRYTRGTSTALIKDLREGRLDVAFVSVPHRPPDGLAVRELVCRPMGLICRRDHRFAGRAEVRLVELAAETFVGPPPGSVGYEAIDQVFAAAGVERAVPYEVCDIATILDFVEHGMGVTLLVAELAGNRPGLRAVPLADDGVIWRLAALTPAEDQVTHAARALLDLLDEGSGGASPPARPEAGLSPSAVPGSIVGRPGD